MQNKIKQVFSTSSSFSFKKRKYYNEPKIVSKYDKLNKNWVSSLMDSDQKVFLWNTHGELKSILRNCNINLSCCNSKNNSSPSKIEIDDFNIIKRNYSNWLVNRIKHCDLTDVVIDLHKLLSFSYTEEFIELYIRIKHFKLSTLIDSTGKALILPISLRNEKKYNFLKFIKFTIWTNFGNCVSSECQHSERIRDYTFQKKFYVPKQFNSYEMKTVAHISNKITSPIYPYNKDVDGQIQNYILNHEQRINFVVLTSLLCLYFAFISNGDLFKSKILNYLWIKKLN